MGLTIVCSSVFLPKITIYYILFLPRCKYFMTPFFKKHFLSFHLSQLHTFLIKSCGQTVNMQVLLCILSKSFKKIFYFCLFYVIMIAEILQSKI